MQLKQLMKERPTQPSFIRFIPSQDVCVKARGVYTGEPDGFKTQSKPRPSLTLNQRCQPSDNHIKSISSGSQVTSILPLQSLSFLAVICNEY